MKNSVLKQLEQNELDANKIAMLYSIICLSFFLLSYFNATWWLMLTGARDVVISAGLLPTILLGGLILIEIWLRSKKMHWLEIVRKIIISDWRMMRSGWRKKLQQIFFWLLYALFTSFVIWQLYDENIPLHTNRNMGLNSNGFYYLIALIMQTILINVMPTIMVGYNVTRMAKVFPYIRGNQTLIEDILVFSVAVIQFGYMHTYISAPIAWAAALVLGVPKWWMYRQTGCMLQISVYHGIISSVGFYLQVLGCSNLQRNPRKKEGDFRPLFTKRRFDINDVFHYT